MAATSMAKKQKTSGGVEKGGGQGKVVVLGQIAGTRQPKRGNNWRGAATPPAGPPIPREIQKLPFGRSSRSFFYYSLFFFLSSRSVPFLIFPIADANTTNPFFLKW